MLCLLVVQAEPAGCDWLVHPSGKVESVPVEVTDYRHAACDHLPWRIDIIMNEGVIERARVSVLYHS